MRSTQESSLSTTDSIKPSGKAYFDSLPPEEKKKYMYNKQTGEVINMETMTAIQEDLIQIQQVNKDTVWNEFWHKQQQLNIEFLNACKDGDVDKVVKLIEQDNALIDIDAQDQNDQTGLHMASQQGFFQLTLLLVKKSAKVNLQDYDGNTPLTIAVMGGYFEVVEFLLKNGGDPNIQNLMLNTPLHYAVESSRTHIVDLLLKNGANPQIQNKDMENAQDIITSDHVKQIFAKHGFTDEFDPIPKKSKTVEFTNLREESRKQSLTQSIFKIFGKTIQPKKQFVQPGRLSSVQLGTLSTDNFNLYKELGKGSFGVVYLVAKKDDPKQLYAMKVLAKDKISSKLLPYVQAEKSILSVVDHPFIVKLHYSFQNQSKLFFIMDFCSGGDLQKLLDLKGKLSENTTKMYVAELTLALEALHQQKILYRDMKPQNIIIDSKGHALLTDFGLAKMDSEEAGSFCGTPAYMAPEVVMRKKYTRVIDWYQLGAVTHEMLYGVPPFYSNDRNELFENIKNQKLKFPSSNKVSQECINFMTQLLERNPTKRLGAQGDADQVRQHPWFANIDWIQVYQKGLPVPTPSFNNQAKEIIHVNFEDERSQGKKIDNWTFIN
ncbi:hypothetical protein pb186bvf_002323 [Paramecium bursaria]